MSACGTIVKLRPNYLFIIRPKLILARFSHDLLVVSIVGCFM